MGSEGNSAQQSVFGKNLGACLDAKFGQNGTPPISML
jgi:hypothetical protein